MTDWKYERTEIAIVLITVAFLIFFADNFTISSAIFLIGTVFCLYNASVRKEREFEIQWHWLITAILSGGLFAFKFRYHALLFITVYSLIRLALSLIRREEVSELDKESEKIRAEYEEKISLIRRQCSDKLKIVSEEFQIEKLRENMTLRADLQKKLSDARKKYEKLKGEEIARLEESYRQRQIEFEKIAAGKSERRIKDFQVNSDKEKNKIIAELKDKYDSEISALNGRLKTVSDELEQKRREIDAINKEHEINLKKLKDDIERKYQEELQKNIRCSFAEYQRKLAEFEKDEEKKIREIEAEFERKNQALQKTLVENKNAFAEEKIKSEREKELAIKELREKLEANAKTIANLQAGINEQDSYIQKLESSTDRLQNEIFCNGELHKLLIETLENAKTEVDIMSPWINWKTKKEVHGLLYNLLRRGVVVKIVYGINNNNYKDGATKNESTDKVVNHLNNQFGKFKNFRVKKSSTHGKIFICDNSYYVLTSMNPLSNDGTLWTEIGERSRNRENLLQYRKEYFNF